MECIYGIKINYKVIILNACDIRLIIYSLLLYANATKTNKLPLIIEMQIILKKYFICNYYVICIHLYIKNINNSLNTFKQHFSHV